MNYIFVLFRVLDCILNILVSKDDKNEKHINEKVTKRKVILIYIYIYRLIIIYHF